MKFLEDREKYINDLTVEILSAIDLFFAKKLIETNEINESDENYEAKSWIKYGKHELDILKIATKSLVNVLSDKTQHLFEIKNPGKTVDINSLQAELLIHITAMLNAFKEDKNELA